MIFNQCLPSSIPYSSTPSILLESALFIITVVFITYVYLIWKYRKFYPIRELAPILTIIQSTALYLFTSITLTNILLYITMDVQPKEKNPKYIRPKTTFFLVFIMLWSRGIFVILSALKGIRIYIAFNYNLNPKSILTKIFRKELYLLVFSFSVALLWCLIYSIWSAKQFYPDFDIRIEQITVISSFANFLELLISMIICYLNYIFHHKYEAFKKYIFWPTFVYGLILYVNSFAIDIKDEQDCLMYLILFSWLICVIRSCIVFYLGIILPVKNCDELRMPFTPSSALIIFDNFLDEKICNIAFFEFLEQKHPDQIDLFNYFIDIRVIDFQKAQESIDSNNSSFDKEKQERFWNLLNIQQSEKMTKYDLFDELNIKSYKHFDQIFTIEYIKTKSFASLKKLYEGYDRATVNLHSLGLMSHITGKIVQRMK